MRIAITGVTGFIGGRLATRALALGHDVTAFSRRAWTGAPHVPLADRHFLELPEPPAAHALAGVDAVVHLAIAPQHARPEVVDAVNRLGSLRLFDTATRAGAGRFVFVSSQSAHAAATSAYGRSKHEVEQALGGDPRVVIVRPGLVYGDSDAGLMGRAARAAAKLRVFPVIGGRAAVAQPIHVDALCDALLELAETADPPHLVELADPQVHPLGDLVRDQARARFGVRTFPVPVPLALARAGVRAATRLHLPSPISEENLDGIAGFVPMDTAADLARVGIAADRAAPAGDAPIPPVQPRRLVLVGAGRIGLVHALTATHHQDMVLVGIVDLDKAAIGRVTAFAGPGIPAFTDLDEALRTVRPDAAIIGTPPSSHVPLARKLLEAGVDVLVEKPVAASDDDRVALAKATVEHPDRHVATGYLSGLLPHLAAIAPDLRAGRFGTPQGFAAHAFVSRVEAGTAEQRGMWELDPSISGGGALVNLGVHVLAMLDVLLGPIEVDRAVLVASGDRAAEDGAALALRAGGVPGTFATAWHLPGFDMPENHLRIDTDRGVVLCTTSCAAFVGVAERGPERGRGAEGGATQEGELQVVHQVDADRGFDLAPMDAGGAFWAEQDGLARRVAGPNSLELATRIEDTITQVYATAPRLAPAPGRVAPSPGTPAADGGRVLPDRRGAPGTVRWTGPALSGTASFSDDPDSIVALPDAPGHFRTLTNDGPLTLVRELGLGPLGRAAIGVSPRRAATTGGRPWEALLVLMRAELARVPRTYHGALVVDAYLVDLATATGDVAPIADALDDLRAACPNARVGVEVNATARLAPHVPALASQLDLVVALGTPAGGGVDRVRELLAPATELVVKTGVLPRELLERAWDEPERWSPEGRVVVHWPGAPGLRAAHRDALAAATLAAGLEEVTS
jgi:predicted dehydrogenase/nucleoside-diphosphate-sugar epimerase